MAVLLRFQVDKSAYPRAGATMARRHRHRRNRKCCGVLFWFTFCPPATSTAGTRAGSDSSRTQAGARNHAAKVA
eukprot:3305126-Prorocentrum_lima.AAC.1